MFLSEENMKYLGYNIKSCNCGGPQYGTDHSPDCAMILDARCIEELIEDEETDRLDAEEERNATDDFLARSYFDCN